MAEDGRLKRQRENGAGLFMPSSMGRTFGSRARLFSGSQEIRNKDGKLKRTVTSREAKGCRRSEGVDKQVRHRGLRTFCYTFGITQDGTKTNLYQELFSLENGTPVPMPRKRSIFTSPLPSTPPSDTEIPVAGEFEVEENTTATYVAPSTEEHFGQAGDRIDLVEVSVKRINTFVEKSPTAFRFLLTEV